jgi:hypothetical protein
MNIELQISEPWELPTGVSEHLLLHAAEQQSSADKWQVEILSGWNAPLVSATLRPRYEEDTLRDLKKGRSIAVNLVGVIKGPNKEQTSQMLVGSAQLAD